MQHHVYSAFGKLLKVEDQNGNDVTDAPVLDPYFTFTGREYDKETGLYYYRARYYDSSTGRFLQQDPDPGRVSSPITLTNKYVYAGNNPTNYVDPTGESFLGDMLAVIAIEALCAFTGGAAAAFVVGQLGITSMLAGAVVGAVVGAAVGAVTGGLYYEATGRKFSDGFKWGAVIGAIAGGLSGAKAGYGKAKFNAAKADWVANSQKVAGNMTMEYNDLATCREYSSGGCYFDHQSGTWKGVSEIVPAPTATPAPVKTPSPYMPSSNPGGLRGSLGGGAILV